MSPKRTTRSTAALVAPNEAPLRTRLECRQLLDADAYPFGVDQEDLDLAIQWGVEPGSHEWVDLMTARCDFINRRGRRAGAPTPEASSASEASDQTSDRDRQDSDAIASTRSSSGDDTRPDQSGPQATSPDSSGAGAPSRTSSSSTQSLTRSVTADDADLPAPAQDFTAAAQLLTGPAVPTYTTTTPVPLVPWKEPRLSKYAKEPLYNEPPPPSAKKC